VPPSRTSPALSFSFAIQQSPAESYIGAMMKSGKEQEWQGEKCLSSPSLCKGLLASSNTSRAANAGCKCFAIPW